MRAFTVEALTPPLSYVFGLDPIALRLSAILCSSEGGC
jgi:hypothetical protein